VWRRVFLVIHSQAGGRKSRIRSMNSLRRLVGMSDKWIIRTLHAEATLLRVYLLTPSASL
jgi:hypothetical protein